MGLLQHNTGVPVLVFAGLNAMLWLSKQDETSQKMGKASLLVLLGITSVGGFAPTHKHDKVIDAHRPPTPITQTHNAEPADKMRDLMAQVSKLNPQQQEILMQGIAKLGDAKPVAAASEVALTLKCSSGKPVDRSGDIEQTVNFR